MRYKIIAAAALAVGFVSVAYAGVKTSTPVVVTKSADGSGNFFGNLHAARNSSDSKARLYCRIQLSQVGDQPFAVCGATDKDGVTLSCSTFDWAFIDTIKAMTVNSHLNVSVDSAGQCTHIFLRNDSAFPGI